MTELKKIDYSNIWDVVKLSVGKGQESFVATNNASMLDAYVTISSGYIALPFGIYSDGLLVGFIMLSYGSFGDDNEPKIAAGNYCVWRFMIDSRYQRRGFGKEALSAAIDYIRTKPCGEAEFCWISFEPDNVVAKALYNSLGFIENGELDGDEIVAVLKL